MGTEVTGRKEGSAGWRSRELYLEGRNLSMFSTQRARARKETSSKSEQWEIHMKVRQRDSTEDERGWLEWKLGLWEAFYMLPTRKLHFSKHRNGSQKAKQSVRPLPPPPLHLP